MNLNFLCCIGAELKNSTQQTTRMPQIYLYRAFEEETVDDMLAPGFFDAAMGIIRQDDLLLLYGPQDSTPRCVYAVVSEITRDGVVIQKIGTQAKDVIVELSKLESVSSPNLQVIIEQIDEIITRLDKNIGDMELPVITDGQPAPDNLSEAVRQLNSQNITITSDSQEPMSGSWTLWGAIKKIFGNVVHFFESLTVVNSRLNALEGRGGPVGAYDFGKTFPNELDEDDAKTVIEVMVDNIWPDHTAITWNTPLSSSTFADAQGVDRTVAEIFNATWVRNSFDGTRIVLTNTPDTTPPVFSLQNVGVDVVGYANETTAGIVRTGEGSDMITDQTTGDISIDDSKGFSLLDRLTRLFTQPQREQIQTNLGIASSPYSAVKLGIVNYVLPNKDFMQCDFNPETRPAGSKTSLRFIAGTVLKTPSGDIFQAGNTDLVLDMNAINQGTALNPGDKVYVYLSSNGDGSASPVISKADNYNGYMIGGFALMCPLRGGSFTNLPTTHPFYSYSNTGGEIMHTSVWHLKNAYDQKMGACAYNPEKRLWVQIYIPSLYNSAGVFQSGSYSTSDGGGTRFSDPTLRLQSVYNASPSNNMTFGEQSQWLKMAGCRYIFDDEFTSTAEGSNEQTNVNGSNQKDAVGGWYDTANRPMISNFGIWEMCGLYWQDIAINAAGGSGWQSQGNLGKGQTFGGQRLHAGAMWSGGPHCGSLSRNASGSGVGRYRYFAARGASPCYELV